MRKDLRIHYVEQGHVLCNEVGAIMIQTAKAHKVTCLNCKRALAKGVQTSIFHSPHSFQALRKLEAYGNHGIGKTANYQ